MVDVGQQAPDFTLPAQDGSAVTLSQYRGRKNVVLSVHIFSFTGGCTDQLSSFRSANADFEEKDTQVLGISADARPTQAAYSTTLGNIPYPILSDFHPKGEFLKQYGIYNEERGAGNRAVFVIDKEGVVRFKRVYASARELKTDDILAEVSKL